MDEQELRRKARAFDLMVEHEITVLRMRDGTFVAENYDFLDAQHKSALEAVELLADQIEDLDDEDEDEDDEDEDPGNDHKYSPQPYRPASPEP